MICLSSREALMSDKRTSRNAKGVLAGWRVEIGEGSILPQGAYSMIELDATTCTFERPGMPSFEMLATDVVHYEKIGVLNVVGRLAVNDNSNAAE
jgi:hypothetical protein